MLPLTVGTNGTVGVGTQLLSPSSCSVTRSLHQQTAQQNKPTTPILDFTTQKMKDGMETSITKGLISSTSEMSEEDAVKKLPFESNNS